MSAHVSSLGHQATAALARIPVVVVYTLFFFGGMPAVLWVLGGRVDVLVHLSPIASPALRIAGALSALGGAAFMAWSMLSLSLRGRGLPISHLPPSELVARGPHAWVRHPIYVGYAALFAGIGIATGSLGRGVFATALLASGSMIYAIGFEEPRLRARFGAAYEAYSRRVPAFPLASVAGPIVERGWSVVRPAVERIANRVVLFRIGPAIFVTYGALGALGAGLALAIVHVLLGGEISAREETAYVVGIALWMLAWARVVALFYQARLLFTSPREALRRVGFVSWGGYIGLFSFPFVFALATDQSGWWLMDRSFVGALVCSCLGRIGCLTYGCCYGRRAPLGLSWTDPDAKPVREGHAHASEPRIATQLLSAIYVAAILPLTGLLLTRAAPGTATAAGALAYTTARFAVECLRDEPRFTRVGLTRGQVACAIGAAGAIAALFAIPARAPTGVPFIALVAKAADGATAPWLAVGAAAFATFLVCGVHWRRVGRW